jgi:hypothetical protein
MNKRTQEHIFAGEIQNPERGFRVVIGSAAIIAVLTGSLPETSQAVTASFLCIYTVMTAIIGVDPFYTVIEKFNNRSRTSNRLAFNYK